MDNMQNSVKILSKLYNNINYWDEYGTSFIIFLVLMIILFLIHGYFYTMTNIQPLQENWTKYRCSPKVIPFAGMINKPSDKTSIQYTEENFNYCIQNILNEISGLALQPLTFITQTLQKIFDGIKGEIQNIRSLFNNIRNNIKSMSQEIMGRVMNIMIPLQQVIIKVRDLFGKVQGVMTTGLYTLFGAYMTLQTLIGAIIQGLVTVLIIIAATIAALIIIAAIPIVGEFVIPILAADIAIFIAICVPTIIIIVFASIFLQLQTQSLIPSFCFDKNTILFLKDGKRKTIKEVEVGEILENGDIITAVLKLDRKLTKMFRLNNTIVSENHSLLYKNKWIKVFQHPDAIEIKDYNEPYLYCLNTLSKTILLNGNIYCDWDEIHDEKYNASPIEKSLIHSATDGGFYKNTEMKLKDGEKKKISDIQIGDILENGEVVNGLVEIYGNDLEQYKFSIEKINVEGGNNLYFIINGEIISTLDLNTKYQRVKKMMGENCKENKLYHLITNTKTFFIDDVEFLDYDNCIEYLVKK